MISRRAFLYTAAASLIGGAAYARRLEPGWLELTRTRVPFFSPTGTPLRVLHLSDLHYSDMVSLDLLEKAVRMGLDEKPDLVCLTGDFMTHHLPEFQAYVDLLKQLPAAAPTFACRGNHDYLPWTDPKPPGVERDWIVPALLEAAGIVLLDNRLLSLRIREREFQLAGVGDLWARQCRPRQAFARSETHLPTLLLSHNPDSKSELGDAAWRLMLCGHSHGGQICLPFWGPLAAPVRDFNYIAGLNAWKERLIFTTRGVGNLHGIRFNCRPEVSILELI